VRPTLKAEEIARLLEYVPAEWRSFTATAIFAGLRKGELCGLQKADVDLDAAVITVRRSYDHETTKGGHADVVPIAPALGAYLREAIDESSSELVFPWSDGSMRSPDCDPEKVLRRALGRAGLVERYEHSCRRCKSQGTPHVEKHEDATLRTMPDVQCEAVAQSDPAADAVPRLAAHRCDAHASRRSRRAPHAAHPAACVGNDNDRHVRSPRAGGPARSCRVHWAEKSHSVC
jgi:hypothetical protein